MNFRSRSFYETIKTIWPGKRERERESDATNSVRVATRHDVTNSTF